MCAFREGVEGCGGGLGPGGGTTPFQRFLSLKSSKSGKYLVKIVGNRLNEIKEDKSINVTNIKLLLDKTA